MVVKAIPNAPVPRCQAKKSLRPDGLLKDQKTAS
jgi:hypothetical protein